MIRKDRAVSQKGGGLLAYINENLKADRIESLEHYALETLWLQINPHKSKRPILVRELLTVRLLQAWLLIPRWNLILRQPILDVFTCMENLISTTLIQQPIKIKSLSLSQVISSVTYTTKEFHMLKSFIYYWSVFYCWYFSAKYPLQIKALPYLALPS